MLVSPFYAQQMEPVSPRRTVTLDGLRGYLALAVYVSHCMFTRHVLATNEWATDINAFALIGKVGVVFFFMITGFLFWSRAAATKSPINPWPFYRGRIFRIVPMYLAASLPIVGLVLYYGRAENAHWKLVAGSVGSILTMGVTLWRNLKLFVPNDAQAGVVWTLTHEWKFYLVFPLLAMMATPRRFAVLVAAAVTWGAVHQGIDPLRYDRIFLFGMGAAYLVQSRSFVQLATHRLAGWVSVVLLLLMPLIFTAGYSLPAMCYAFVLFASFAAGNTVLGLLIAAGSRVLGSMSYSIYLLHGLVLYLSRPLLRKLMASPDHELYFWLFVAGMGCVIVLVSALTYRWIEHPFIELEKTMRRKPNAPSTVPVDDQPSITAASTAAVGSFGAA